MSRGDFPSAKQDQFNVRLPDGVRDEIQAAAAESGRSMNAEIVHRLTGQQKTLRDEFAMAALPAVIDRCVGGRASSELLEDYFARKAYAVADAMLAARSKGGEA